MTRLVATMRHADINDVPGGVQAGRPRTPNGGPFRGRTVKSDFAKSGTRRPSSGPSAAVFGDIGGLGGGNSVAGSFLGKIPLEFVCKNSVVTLRRFRVDYVPQLLPGKDPYDS